MAGDLSFAEIAWRVLDGDPEAYAALLRSDLAYPLGEVMWLDQAAPGGAGDGVSSAATCRVFYTLAEDGRDTLAMAHLGAFMVAALGALMAEEGWSPATAATLARAHQRAAAEGAEETLAGWAMGATVDVGAGASRLYGRAASGVGR